MVDGQLIQLALHTPASDREVNEYFAKVMAIVEAQRGCLENYLSLTLGDTPFELLYAAG